MTKHRETLSRQHYLEVLAELSQRMDSLPVARNRYATRVAKGRGRKSDVIATAELWMVATSSIWKEAFGNCAHVSEATYFVEDFRSLNDPEAMTDLVIQLGFQAIAGFGSWHVALNVERAGTLVNCVVTSGFYVERASPRTFRWSFSPLDHVLYDIFTDADIYGASTTILPVPEPKW